MPNGQTPMISPPPPIDPEVFVAIVLIGAITGAVNTLITFLAIRAATAGGREARFLPELPPFFKQGAP